MTVSPLTSTSPRPYDSIDLSSRAFWSTSAADREKDFAVLRAERPVSWHPPVEDALMQDPNDHGYWAVTRHADIVTVSRDSDTFLSGKGVLFENIPEELLEASQSFLAMDPPRHTMIRKVVHAAFTPRQVRRIEDSIKANAKDIVAELRDAGQRGRLRRTLRQGATDPHAVRHGRHPRVRARSGGRGGRCAGVVG